MVNLKFKTEDIKKQKKTDLFVEFYDSEKIREFVKGQHLSLKIDLELIDEEILVSIEITGQVTLECARCLEIAICPFNLTLKTDFPVSLEEIDLTDEIEENLVINLPGKPLCQEDCMGICPRCGKNQNISKCACTGDQVDVRWAKLKDFNK